MLLTWGMGGGGNGGGGGGQPSLVLGFSNLGNGAVDTSSQGVAIAPTFTRATAAAAKLSTGLWKLDVASGTARYSFNGATTAVSTTGGYFAEGAATQLSLNPRDMTQAAWIAVTMTVAQTSTGIDGVTNSCTRITAAGANSTILQTLVAAATSRTYSCWVKRITGVGTIILKQGTATLDITASINSATFTRVELNDNELNVAYGLQINTSGDALDVDCNQFEAGGFASSPIPAAGTRNADVLTYPSIGWLSQTAGTIFTQFQHFATGVSKILAQIDDGTGNENLQTLVNASDNFAFNVSVGGVSQASLTTVNTIAAATTGKQASSYALNDFALSGNGGAVSTDTSGTLPTPTTLRISGSSGGSLMWYGTIARISYWSRRLPDSALVALTA